MIFDQKFCYTDGIRLGRYNNGKVYLYIHSSLEDARDLRKNDKVFICSLTANNETIYELRVGKRKAVRCLRSKSRTSGARINGILLTLLLRALYYNSLTNTTRIALLKKMHNESLILFQLTVEIVLKLGKIEITSLDLLPRGVIANYFIANGLISSISLQQNGFANR